LHDVLLSGEPSAAEASAKDDSDEKMLIGRHDAVLTCSPEDAALLKHDRVAVVPNGFAKKGDYTPSRGSRKLLFPGPFRYQPNLAGIRQFLEHVYPTLIRDVPDVELNILGGDGSGTIAACYSCFEQRGVTVVDRAVDVEPWLAACALTINPLAEVRGSCVKVIESVGFGRVCLSTRSGARGFRELGIPSLVIVPEVGDFAEPLRRLLLDEDYRVKLEQPDNGALETRTWESAARAQLSAYRRWFGSQWD
jgi:hypothetical protein